MKLLQKNSKEVKARGLILAKFLKNKQTSLFQEYFLSTQ